MITLPRQSASSAPPSTAPELHYMTSILRNFPEHLQLGSFWGNTIYDEDGASCIMIPDAIVTGRKLIHQKHYRLSFVNYIQTHEEADNNITNDRTIGAIFFFPVGNYQGTHVFMNLNKGKTTTCNRWILLLMPTHAVDRVQNLVLGVYHAGNEYVLIYILYYPPCKRWIMW